MNQALHAFTGAPKTTSLLKHWYALLDHIPIGVYLCDRDGVLSRYNEQAARLWGIAPPTGQTRHKFIGPLQAYELSGAPLDPEESPVAVVLRTQEPVREREFVLERTDGTRLIVLVNADPLFDDNGDLLGAVNCIQDITAHKQAEFQQRMLLDELNHRVKNNLQMLHSLLRTSQRETDDDRAKSVLEDAARRVGAIAAAQRVLYSAESATSFSADEFLQAVCHATQLAFAGDVKIQVAPSSGTLSNEVSMPLALILNELLTNAVKHGLKDRRHGTIKVRLAHAGDRFDLIVEDDGTGFELQPLSRRSSGLGLVNGLARQLGGTFDVQRAAGAKCIVSFPENRNVLH